MDTAGARAMLLDLYGAGLAAAEPVACTAAAIRTAGINRPDAVIAIGKAAPGMAWGAADVFGHVPGIVVSHHPAGVPPGMLHLVAAHPLPDSRSIAAGGAVMDLAASLGADTRLLVLISGGASALVEVPIEGLTDTDLALVSDQLLRCGAAIDEINAVRRTASRIKGGGLLAATKADVVTVAISDVVGDDPTVIGSGPTVPTGADAVRADAVLRAYAPAIDLPDHIMAALRGADSDSHLHRQGVVYLVAASGAAVRDCIVSKAAEEELPVQALAEPVVGDVRDAVPGFLDQASRAGLTVGYGETTVVVTGDGEGGRNQHAALLAATHIADREDTLFLAAGTDGRDGPTAAAGALVDGGSIARAVGSGRDIAADLAAFDSHAALRASGDLIETGPTGTNVGDIWMTWREG